jgi:hypothetical protein
VLDSPDSRLTMALADRYRIERKLGQGGMATVYLAEDLKHHRKVAVKVLRPDLAATLGPERFVRGIEVAAQLHHPHILPLYDSGEAGGFLFYVMPYEEGKSLRERLEKESDGTLGEYEIPVAGGVPRLLVRFDDPAMSVFGGSVQTGNGQFYFAVAKIESDMYVMDLVRK